MMYSRLNGQVKSMTSSQIRCAIRGSPAVNRPPDTNPDIKEAKTWLLETQISDYRLGPTFAGDVRSWLADMPHRELARRLSGGLTYGEIPAAINNMVVDTHTSNDFIMKPLPNHLFTRDTSCWIYNGVSINPMAKPACQRETNNLRAIYRWHPAFADGDFIKYFGDENIYYDHATLEGGDVLVIGRGRY